MPSSVLQKRAAREGILTNTEALCCTYGKKNILSTLIALSHKQFKLKLQLNPAAFGSFQSCQGRQGGLWLLNGIFLTFDEMKLQINPIPTWKGDGGGGGNSTYPQIVFFITSIPGDSD